MARPRAKLPVQLLFSPQTAFARSSTRNRLTLRQFGDDSSFGVHMPARRMSSTPTGYFGRSHFRPASAPLLTFDSVRGRSSSLTERNMKSAHHLCGSGPRVSWKLHNEYGENIGESLAHRFIRERLCSRRSQQRPHVGQEARSAELGEHALFRLGARDFKFCSLQITCEVFDD